MEDSSKKKRTVSAGQLRFRPVGESGHTYLGLTPGFTVNIAGDKIESQTAENGQWELDDSTPTKTTRTGKITCRQDSLRNLAMFVRGSIESVIQTSGPVTGEDHIVMPDRYYQLGASASNLTGVRGVSALSFAVTATAWTATATKASGDLAKATASPSYAFRCTTAGTTGATEPTWPTTIGATVTDGTVTWTNVGILTPEVDTDYTVDAARGTFFVLYAARVHPTLGVTWTAGYTKSANTRDRITTAELTEVTGNLWFVANNPKGENRDLVGSDVTLTPSGNWVIKSDEPSYVEYSWDVSFNMGPNGEPALLIDGQAV